MLSRNGKYLQADCQNHLNSSLPIKNFFIKLTLKLIQKKFCISNFLRLKHIMGLGNFLRIFQQIFKVTKLKKNLKIILYKN